MLDSDIELHEPNDPIEHTDGEFEVRRRDDSDGVEVGDVDAPSSTNPELRRDQTPEAT